ncbi:MAG: hypothetical protein ACOVNU_03170 [Candidatus Kapaibacteriota bacterium]
MINKMIYNYDFNKIDKNLLNHISNLYLNDVVAFISSTNVISYSSIIDECKDEIDNIPDIYNTLLFLNRSSIAVLNNLHTGGIISESQPIIKNDLAPQLIMRPLLKNIICNYRIIPYLNKTIYYEYLVASNILPNFENIISIILNSCQKFAGDN